MSIFSEDFSSYALGSNPSTWGPTIWDVPPSSGVVEAVTLDGVPQQGFQLGTLQTTTLGAFDSVSNQFVLNMGLGPNLNDGIPVVACQFGTGGYEIFGVGLNGDSTLFARVLADPSQHTTTPAGFTSIPLFRNTSYNIIANVFFGTYVDIDSITKIYANVNVAVNGIQEINQQVLTGVPVTTLPGLGVNRWVFQPGTIGGSMITNIVVDNSSGSISPPSSSQPVDIYQGVIEVVYAPVPNAVIYQGVIELVQSLVPPPTAIAHCVMHG